MLVVCVRKCRTFPSTPFPSPVLTSLHGRSHRQEYKLLFGLLFSMRDTVVALSPKQPTEGLHCFSTSTYKLHYLETQTGLR